MALVLSVFCHIKTIEGRQKMFSLGGTTLKNAKIVVTLPPKPPHLNNILTLVFALSNGKIHQVALDGERTTYND